MISRRSFTIAAGLLIGCPPLAMGKGEVWPDQRSIDTPRGYMMTFARRGPVVDGLPVLRFEDCIWTGSRWLSVFSPQGERFIRQIEQEIRDGTYDAE